jgi:N-acetylglutamate synthase-like GNAT family acetyltransferase
MNRQQRRQIERDFKKKTEDSFVKSNNSFLTMEGELSSFGFQKQPIFLSDVSNESFKKLKLSPCLIFNNRVVRAVLSPEKNGIEITTLLVYPDYLSQGYGKLMLDFLLVNFRKAKVDYVSLYPQKKDPNDQISLAKCQMTLENFYSKRGFEWNLDKTAMVINWDKFEIYEKTNQVIGNIGFVRIFNPRWGMGLMAA